MGKGKEGDGKVDGGGGKGWTPVPDCESAEVATLKCGGPPTMPEENRGPWSKKFENRWCRHNLPQSLAGIEQVLTIRLLGVTFLSSL